MRFRKLRIAWSVGCGILCVLLIVLWIRSYYRVGFLFWHPTKTLQFDVTSISGGLSTSACDDPELLLDKLVWRLNSVPLQEDLRSKSTSLGSRWSFQSDPQAKHFHCRILGFKCIFNSTPRAQHFDFSLTVPFWFLVLASAAAMATPWLQWLRPRFSLRTLLIATTLVAVVLGAIVWLR
jgi:hypothetical protein